MKTAAQIKTRIETLHKIVVKMRHSKKNGGLVYESAIAKVQGEILGLEWVLGLVTDNLVGDSVLNRLGVKRMD